MCSDCLCSICICDESILYKFLVNGISLNCDHKIVYSEPISKVEVGVNRASFSPPTTTMSKYI